MNEKEQFLTVVKPAQLVTHRELEVKIYRQQTTINWLGWLIFGLTTALIIALGALRAKQ